MYCPGPLGERTTPLSRCSRREMLTRSVIKATRFLARRIVDKKSSTIAAQRSGGKEIDDLLNGFVGAVVGGFELAGRLVMGVGAMVEAAVGERAAEPFVKEQEEQGDLDAFGGEAVGVAGAVTLQQAVGFELAQVVAELVQAVGCCRRGGRW